jgi:hypothetical protein
MASSPRLATPVTAKKKRGERLATQLNLWYLRARVKRQDVLSTEPPRGVIEPVG